MLDVALGLLIGLVIGGLGGGGGVLTVPALVYLVGQPAQDATTGSVVIVGVTAVVGVLARVGGRAVGGRGGQVRWRTGLALGAVGVPAAAAGTLLNQRVPQPALLLSFAALAVAAALAMLVESRTPARVPAGTGRGAVGVRVGVGIDVVGRRPARILSPARTRAATIVLCGLVIGFLTGFLGVGGGFLVVPALVVVLRIPMADAVGTSLLVIAVNSVAALAVRAGAVELDAGVLVPFTIAAVAGSFLGKSVGERLTGPTLGRAFAVLLLLVGAFVAVESVSAL